MKTADMKSWKAEIFAYLEEIDDPHWIRYILQTVHMIWNSAEEAYPPIEEEDEDYDY